MGIQIRLSIMMFLQFFVWGAWFVTMGNYMGEHGLGAEISWAYSVCYIAAMISPFFLGMVADRFFASQRVLGLLHILGGLVMFLPPYAAGHWGGGGFVLVIFAHMLCYMPTLGLVNALSFHNLTDQEKQFPLIRVFGTIGWIAANNVVSFGLGADKTANMFYVTALSGVLLGLFCFSLPHTPPPAKGKRVTIRDVLGLDALTLFRSPSFVVFVACSFLICIPLAAYYAFAPVFVDAVGFEKVGTWMSLGQVSEVLFMVAMPVFFMRFGVKWMLTVGMLAWVLRYGLFAGASSTDALWMVIGGIVLHGICYDFFFVTGQIYVDQKAPVDIRGKAQGLLVFITIGLGMFIGTMVAGKIVKYFTALDPESGAEVIDWFGVWVTPTIGAGLVLLLFVLSFREAPKTSDKGASVEA